MGVNQIGQAGSKDCGCGIAMQESVQSNRVRVRVCFGIGVYERVEPEQVNMFTGELIQ